MPRDFLAGDFRVLTPEAFDFVLENELKRAVRSQNFVTLVLIEPRAADPGAAHEVARLVGREVRETDLLTIAPSPGNGLSVVLLDADLQSSLRVIDRVRSRVEHYHFSAPVDLEIGAACCPTHGADADTLRRAAREDAAAARQGSRGPASNAQ